MITQECSHSFCKRCILRVMNVTEHAGTTTTTTADGESPESESKRQMNYFCQGECPLCRAKIISINLHLNLAITGIINELLVTNALPPFISLHGQL